MDSKICMQHIQHACGGIVHSSLECTKETIREKTLIKISLLLGIPTSDIDLSASYTQAGGDSLSAIALASVCKRDGISLTAELILSSSSLQSLLDSIAQRTNSRHLEQMTTLMASAERQCYSQSVIDSSFNSTSMIREPITPGSPALFNVASQVLSHGTRKSQMTEMQLTLVQGSEKVPGTNIIRYYETCRPDDVQTIKEAWERVVQLEPLFRTRFGLNGEGYLIERDAAAFLWSEILVPDSEAYDRVLAEEPLETSVVMDFKTVTLMAGPEGPGKSTIIWRIHHALIDGHSAELVINKVRKVILGLPIPSGLSFAQYAVDLRAFQERFMNTGQNFWKKKHDLHPTAAGRLLLPTARVRPSVQRNTSTSIYLNVPLIQISTYVRKIGITAASLYHAAWALALSRFVDSDSVVFGSVMSGRELPLAGVEDVIGPVINLLPFHISLDRSITTMAYVKHAFACLIELNSFHWTTPEMGFSRDFNTALAIERNPPGLGFSSLSTAEIPYTKVVSDIPLYALIKADGVIEMNYHCDSFERAHIQSLGEAFRSALHALLASDSALSIALDGLLSSSTRLHLRRLGNCNSFSTTVTSVSDNLVTLFERVVAQFPNATAVQKGADLIPYADLSRLTRHVSVDLCSLIQLGEVISVHADQSINWIIAIYAVLMAGGVYCPLDPRLPSDIRDQIYQSANGKVFLTPYAASMSTQPKICTATVSVENLLAFGRDKGNTEFTGSSRKLLPSMGAYLCFTSGSSGVPKGVICTHAGLVAFQRELKVRLFASHGVRISQVMSPAFDGSIHEIFSALSYGATLVLNDSADPFFHLKTVNSAVLTPSVAKVLSPGDFPDLETVQRNLTT